MGTVHGVYLKYVGMSALSYVGYSLLSGDDDSSSASSTNATNSMLRLMFGYSTVVNGMIAVLFKTERGMAIIGKDKQKGTIPLWSYVVFFPFHLPTILYTHVHTRTSKYNTKLQKQKDENDIEYEKKKTSKPVYEIVPVASEVQPGWWVGGCYGHELRNQTSWGGIIDLTVEFPESCRSQTKHYLSAPTWDGVPLSPEDLEHAATFAVNSRKDGDVLVHCAHGRGRSTTVMCACLVKAGLFDNWLQAFEVGIKPYRPVCKLNARMRQNLTSWQSQYVDGKKGS